MTKEYEDFLAHHGIKGMKWGVRRFQNEDGSLTDEGRRRIADTVGGGYLNPPKGKIKRTLIGDHPYAENYGRHGLAKKAIAERDNVRKKYTNEYWEAVKNGMPEDEYSKQGEELWDKYKSQYASATLKDLKLRDTENGRKEVQRIIAGIDPDYGNLMDDMREASGSSLKRSVVKESTNVGAAFIAGMLRARRHKK